MKRAVTVWCVVEIRDGLVELFRREIRQKLLECAEADGALIEIRVAFRLLEADAVLHKAEHAPVAVVRLQIAFSVLRPDERQDAARVGRLPAQMLRHKLDVLHQAGDVTERMMIDLLQNVAPASGRRHQIGTVDVAAAIRGAGRRLRVQTELTQDRKLMFVHSDNLFLLICSARRSVVLFCISF